MTADHPADRINKLWAELLGVYPDGVSNTSTTKYLKIRQYLAELLNVPVEEVYATGAKTRTSNLDTRLVQGNQAGRHTKVGVAFLQREGDASDIDRLSRSAVVTIKKFVDGTDTTQYDVVLVFVESGSEMKLTRIVQKTGQTFDEVLHLHFADALVETVGTPARTDSSDIGGKEQHNPIGSTDNMVEEFRRGLINAGLNFSPEVVTRFISALLAKRFLILTGLAGSGKTMLAQAFSQWVNPSYLVSDLFSPGATIPSDNANYFIRKSDELSVEFWNSPSEESAVKVSLPREMISEWANYIKLNEINEIVSAREIREGVKAISKFSGQMHSFETHLKAAAFALIRHQAHGPIRSGCVVVPVGADWSGNENILGYPNGIVSEEYVSKPALNLLLQARSNPGLPHFLILDEMNLSHVERYFSDILSSLESGAEITLHSDANRISGDNKPVPQKVVFPGNLFVIGTVNVDETTYMFSPKVLDRANVMEFRMAPDDLAGFLTNPKKPNLAELSGKGGGYAQIFTALAKSDAPIPEHVKTSFAFEMNLFFSVLQNCGAEFGFRTVYEAGRFIHFYQIVGGHSVDSGSPEGEMSEEKRWFSDAFDSVVVQKILPKLHGSRAKLGPLLKMLWFLCVDDLRFTETHTVDEILEKAKAAAVSNNLGSEPTLNSLAKPHYTLSAEKIARMWQSLHENGFTSFAEA